MSKKPNRQQSDPPIASKTREQLALELNYTISTFKRKLKEVSIVLPGGLISPKWQKIIYEAFWYPPGVRKMDYEDL